MVWFGIDDTAAIMLWSLVFSIISFEAARRLGNRKRQKEIKAEIDSFQKEMNKALKEKDDAAIKRLEVRQKQVTDMMTEMMMLPMKSMIVAIPLFLITISLIQQNFPSFVITLPFGIHIDEITSLRILSPSVYGPRGFFIVSSIFWGMVVEMVYSKKFEKKPTKVN